MALQNGVGLFSEECDRTDKRALRHLPISHTGFLQSGVAIADARHGGTGGFGAPSALHVSAVT